MGSSRLCICVHTTTKYHPPSPPLSSLSAATISAVDEAGFFFNLCCFIFSLDLGIHGLPVVFTLLAYGFCTNFFLYLFPRHEIKRVHPQFLDKPTRVTGGRATRVETRKA